MIFYGPILVAHIVEKSYKIVLDIWILREVSVKIIYFQVVRATRSMNLLLTEIFSVAGASIDEFFRLLSHFFCDSTASVWNS